MLLMVLAFAALALLALILLVLFLKSRQEDATRLGGVHPNPSSSPPASPEVLIHEGRMLEAIKALRTRHGLGLAEAKAMADHFRDHGAWPGTAAPPGPAQPGLAPSADLQALIREGHLIQAIKLAREQHPGMDLKEAKELVEVLAARMR